MTDVDGRTRHYGQFYGVPGCGDGADHRPLWVVHGNCQAEALRVLLDGAPDAGYRTVRIPPVHELTSDDLVHLQALVSRAAVLISQPVRPDYRDLPLGTAQLAGWLPPGAVVLRWPVVHYIGLFPYQVIMRHPVDGSADPPVVPYHDLRTVAAALASGPLRPLHASSTAPAQVFREVAASSLAELARRESASADVTVSDVLRGSGAEAKHTINHPGNVVLRALAGQVLASLGSPQALADPGRDLLGGIRAPLSEQVLDALGLSGPARPVWLVHGETVDPEQVHQVQGAFYRADPQWLQAAVTRHAALLDQLGLAN